jgi:hypothetical protein
MIIHGYMLSEKSRPCSRRMQGEARPVGIPVRCAVFMTAPFREAGI